MNAFQVLGLQPGATSAVIKRAYRKLAQKYHPDRNKETNAEATFVLVKEAYEFLISGKSNSGAFENKPVPPKTKPKPTSVPKEQPIWQTGYRATNVEKIQLLVSFSDAYTGANVRVPNTPFTIFVRPGTQNAHQERRLCKTQYGHEAYLDIEYRLYDPIGFYKLQTIDGVLRFCCHLEMTSGQLLCGFEHALKNVNPSGGPVIITVPVDHSSAIRIPNMGIRLDEAGRRSDLYIVPVVRFVPIEKEIQPVLVSLNTKVQESLKTYNYFK